MWCIKRFALFEQSPNKVKQSKVKAFDLSLRVTAQAIFLIDIERIKKHKHTSDDGMREHRNLHNTSAWNEQLMH